MTRKFLLLIFRRCLTNDKDKEDDYILKYYHKLFTLPDFNLQMNKLKIAIFEHQADRERSDYIIVII